MVDARGFSPRMPLLLPTLRQVQPPVEIGLRAYRTLRLLFPERVERSRKVRPQRRTVHTGLGRAYSIDSMASVIPDTQKEDR